MSCGDFGCSELRAKLGRVTFPLRVDDRALRHVCRAGNRGQRASHQKEEERNLEELLEVEILQLHVIAYYGVSNVHGQTIYL